MRDPDTFEAKGTILERIQGDRYWVQMANGHRVAAYLLKKSNLELSDIKVDDRVAIFFSPADMAKGMISRKLELQDL